MTRAARALGVVSGLVLGAAPAAVRAGCACGAWDRLPVSLNVCLADETGACETPLTEAARDAVSNWRALVDLWRVVPPAQDVAAPQDGLHSVALRSAAELGRDYGADVAPWVLGVTFAPAVAGLADRNAECPLPGGIVCPTYGDGPGEDVDVVLVADRTFTTDALVAWASHVNGNAAPVWDAHQVLAHELGHALGLRHESRVAALMNPFHLEFPGVVALGDDARAARAHYPAVDTHVGDLAVVGFASENGTLFGAFAETDVAPVGGALRPGVDRVRVSGFTITNRGAQPLPGIVTEIRVGEAVAGTLVCDLAAYGDCPLLDVAEVVVPVAARHPGGRLPLSVHVRPLVGEPVEGDNTLVLGFVQIERAGGPEPGADAGAGPTDDAGGDAGPRPLDDAGGAAVAEAGGEDARLVAIADAADADAGPALGGPDALKGDGVPVSDASQVDRDGDPESEPGAHPTDHVDAGCHVSGAGSVRTAPASRVLLGGLLGLLGLGARRRHRRRHPRSHPDARRVSGPPRESLAQQVC